MKKAVILGGGKDQIPLIRELNSRGYETILIDYYDNPPAKAISDKHYKKSTHNLEEVEKVVINEQPDIITSIGNDPVIPIIANMCEKYNIKNNPISYQDSLNATDKELMKSVFEKNNIPTSTTINMADIDTSKIQFPIIIKPKKGTSSKGVFRFNSNSEFQDYLNNENNPNDLIVEEFTEGDEISVDCIVINGKAYVLNITQLFQIPHLKNNFSFLYTQSPYQSEHSQSNQVQYIANQIAKAFQINFGPFFFQAKVNSNKISVIEMGARIAGGNKTEFIKTVTGYDILSSFISQLEGKDVSVPQLTNNSYFSKIHIYAREGIIHKINYNMTSGVIDVAVLKNKGDILEGSVAAKDRVLTATLKADSPKQLENIRLNFVESVRILDENNQDMILREYYDEN